MSEPADLKHCAVHGILYAICCVYCRGWEQVPPEMRARMEREIEADRLDRERRGLIP